MNGKFAGLVWRSLFLCLLLSGGLQAAALEGRIEKDILFASVDGHELKLDLYLPPEGRDAPIGGLDPWRWLARRQQKDCPLAWLTQHGYAVASISYRLTDKAIFPAQIHDCKAAVRWLRAHAKDYGYQKDHVAVAGSSAGGHLAALMGTSGDVKILEGDVGGNLDQSSRVDAVIDFYGATDFVLRSKTQPHRANAPGSVVHRLLGGGADQKVELAKQASAAYHVTADDPPMLVFHGDQDKTVLLDQSQRIREVYTQAGLSIEFHVLEGAGHGGKMFHDQMRRDLQLAFLEKVMRKESSPP